MFINENLEHKIWYNINTSLSKRQPLKAKTNNDSALKTEDVLVRTRLKRPQTNFIQITNG